MANDYKQAAAWCAERVALGFTSRDADMGHLAARAVRAFEALASGRVETLWLYAGEWRVNSRGRQYSAPDPLDAITKALEVYDA